MTPAEKAKKLLNNLSEFNADYDQLLCQLEDLRKQCETGILNQKVAAKLDVPMDVYEVFPQVALGCISQKLVVLNAIRKVAETAEPDSQGFTLSINLMPDLRGDMPVELLND